MILRTDLCVIALLLLTLQVLWETQLGEMMVKKTLPSAPGGLTHSP